MPYYNKAHYIERCMYSLTNQNYTDFIALIIDDNSTKEQHDLLVSRSQKFPFVKILTNDENKGQHVVKMRGIRECTTELVTFLDTDDEMHVNALYNLVKTYDQTKADIVGGKIKFLRKRKWIDFWWLMPEFETKTGFDLLNATLYKEFNWIICGRLFKTKLWKKALNLMGKYAEYRIDEYEDRLELALYTLFAKKFVHKNDFYTINYFYDIFDNSHSIKKGKWKRKVVNMKRALVDAIIDQLYKTYLKGGKNTAIVEKPFSLPKNIEDEIIPENLRYIRW